MVLTTSKLAAAIAAVLIVPIASLAEPASVTWRPVPRDRELSADSSHFNASCRVGRGSSLGSGVYVGDTEDGRGVVLTAAHVGRGEGSAPWRLTFPNGESYTATAYQIDETQDVASLLIPKPKRVQPAPVRSTRIRPGEIYTACGYGSDGRFAAASGRVGGEFYSDRPYGPDRWVRLYDTVIRPGDSGGPVFDESGQVVGILWGANHQERHISLTPASLLRQFCPGGVCGRPLLGGRSVFPAQPRLRPQPQPQPAPTINQPPPAVPDLPEVDPPQDDVFEDVLSRLKALEEMEPVPGPPGPPGPKGDPGEPGSPGPPGSSGESPDASSIANLVAASLDPKFSEINARLSALESQPPPPPPGSSSVSHFVLVADQSASYWPRVGSVLARAQEAYHRISSAEPPDYPVGPLPQLVRYVDSTPREVIKGQREVEIALSAIARGDFNPEE